MSDGMHSHEESLHNQEVEFEREDLGAKPILTFLITLTVGCVLVALVLRGMYSYLSAYENHHQPVQSPLVPPARVETRIVTPGDIARFPQPRLESDELLALSAYVARQSRGQPIAPPNDERLAPFAAAGRDFFNKRQGQLNLSCALCHDDNWGKRLAGNIVPQGHPTGYPIYRLEWQSLGSLQRRLRNCISGMRAEVPDYGAPEYVNLELFLMRRARGMPMESPAVRP